MSAESAYFFRHALLRDAAYQLQLPGDRARLHRIAFEVLQEAAGPRAPDLGEFEERTPSLFRPHPSDASAEDLAHHAAVALSDAEESGQERFRSARLHYLHRAAESAEFGYRLDAALRLWREYADAMSGADRGRVLRRVALVAQMAARPRDVESVCREALPLLRAGGARRSEGIVMGLLGVALREMGRLEEAGPALEESREIMRDIGDRLGEGQALGAIGILLKQRGRLEEAERAYELAIAMNQSSSDRRSEGITKGNLALLYQVTGRAEEAERTFAESLEIHREVGNRRSEGVTLGNIARFLLDQGRYEEAEPRFRESLAQIREFGVRGVEGSHLCAFALLLLARSRREEATQAWRAGTEIVRELGDARLLERLRDTMREWCDREGFARLER